MATVLLPVEIDFADYFNDFGFGDGNGPEAAIAARYLEQMVGEINARLDRDDLVGVTVEEGADGSLHNPSTIQILHWGTEITVERVDGRLAVWNDDYNTFTDNSIVVALDRILEEVENDFESRFLQKENA